MGRKKSFIDDLLIQLYRQGLTDQQIAEAIGKSKRAIAWRRRKQLLPANHKSRRNGVRHDDELAQAIMKASGQRNITYFKRKAVNLANQLGLQLPHVE